MIQTKEKFLCYKCNENVDCKQDILDDGKFAEVIMRCGKCGQSNFEANAYLAKELSAATRERRQWFTAGERAAQAQVDLEHAILANDPIKEKKARADLEKWKKKQATSEEAK